MRIASFFAVSIIGIAGPAAAQSGYCGSLQMQLAALGGGGSGGGNDRALRADLAQAREQARRNNCGGGLFRKKGKACGQINSRINRLTRQLASSSRPRGGLFSSRSSRDQDRNRILRAMARSGCNTQPSSGGRYRTICVRICDGYYYPLSFASSRQRFNDDAERCAAQYGPGESMLFYHPNPGGDASQAVSMTNERYADQPYAFAYRQAFYPQCAARLQQGLAILGERVLASLPVAPPPPSPASPFEKAIADRVPTENIPLPIARQDPAEDPETVANRAGGFVPHVAMPALLIAGVDSSVRPVGEPYLFAEANPGAPRTLPGYQPPELKDFRPALRASMLPTLR